MARIKDKKKIPIKDVPNVEDYLVGSDSEDGGKTSNFKIGAIRGDSSMSDAAVKVAYENNPDTNEFSDAEKSKLDGLSDTSIYDNDGTIATGVTRRVAVDGTLKFQNASFQGISFSQPQFSIFHPDLAFIGADNSFSLKDGFPATLDGSHGVKVRIGSGGVPASPTVGQVLAAKDVDGDLEWVDASSGGDMLASVYDPIIDANTAKVGITAQQASDITTNNAKVGVTVEEANPDVVSKVEAEAGVATTERIWTAERVKEAIVALGGSGSVDDTAYGVSWDGVTTVAPSKNAVYDMLQTAVFTVDTTGAATPIVPIFWQGLQAEFDIKFSGGVPDNYFTVVTDANPPAIEGTDIASTGEVGGTKYLREDGDGTSSWQTIAGGDVTKFGTAFENQVAIWKTDGSIEGLSGLTFDDVTTKVLNVGFGADNQGTIKIGGNAMISSNDTDVSSLFNGSLIKTGTALAFTGNITSAGTINGATITSGTLNGSVTGTNTGDNSPNTTYANDYRAANFIADTDYLSPSTASTTYAPVLGADDNYVTDAEKIVIGNTSNSNSGDVTLTTTGTSGAASLVGQVLNIPNYATGGGSAPLFYNDGLYGGFAGRYYVSRNTKDDSASTFYSGGITNLGTLYEVTSPWSGETIFTPSTVTNIKINYSTLYAETYICYLIVKTIDGSGVETNTELWNSGDIITTASNGGFIDVTGLSLSLLAEDRLFVSTIRTATTEGIATGIALSIALYE